MTYCTHSIYNKVLFIVCTMSCSAIPLKQLLQLFGFIFSCAVHTIAVSLATILLPAIYYHFHKVVLSIPYKIVEELSHPINHIYTHQLYPTIGKESHSTTDTRKL